MSENRTFVTFLVCPKCGVRGGEDFSKNGNIDDQKPGRVGEKYLVTCNKCGHVGEYLNPGQVDSDGFACMEPEVTVNLYAPDQIDNILLDDEDIQDILGEVKADDLRVRVLDEMREHQEYLRDREEALREDAYMERRKMRRFGL